MTECHTKLSVVIPVFNSAGSLPALREEIEAAFTASKCEYEVLFIDDGSKDDSWPLIKRFAEESPSRIKAIRLMRNYGQHNAVMCGMRHASGRLIVTMDDDLQHSPSDVAKLIDKLESDTLDLVYGNPIKRQHQTWRNFGSNVIQLFVRFAFRLPCPISPFRVMRRDLVRAMLGYDLNFTFIDGLVSWNSTRIGECLVEHRPRRVGRSGYSFTRLITHSFNILTNFSIGPLRVVTYLGFVSSAAGLLLASFYIFQYLRSAIGVPGYASTMVVVLVLGGLQFLSLGIMGEYLGRLHLNVNRKPQYTIREIVDASSKDNSPSAQADSRH